MIEQRCLCRIRLEVGRCLHAHRSKEILRDIIFEVLAAELLNDVGGNRRSGIAVGHSSPRSPPRNPRLMVVRQRICEANFGRILRIFAQVHVIPPGRMLEEVYDAHGIGGFPPIHEPHFRELRLGDWAFPPQRRPSRRHPMNPM